MGYLRFHRSTKILPGIRLNLSKSGPSVSFGGRGAHYTIGPKGTRTTVGLPGSGLSYTSFKSNNICETDKAGSEVESKSDFEDFEKYEKYIKSWSWAVVFVAFLAGWFGGIGYFFIIGAVGLVVGLVVLAIRFKDLDPNSPAETWIATELDTYKKETIAAWDANKAEHPETPVEFFQENTFKRILESLEQAISGIGNDLDLEIPLEQILLTLSKLSFLIQVTMVGGLESLDFVSIQTRTGINSKDDVVDMFKSLSTLLDTMADCIRRDIHNGVPFKKIYSSQRPRGRLAKIKKVLEEIKKEFSKISVK